MYLLIDECCAKCLARHAAALGHVAQLSRDIGSLGLGASDRDIFDFARRNRAVIVTGNISDFVALGRRHSHPGMIFLPCVRPRVQTHLLRRALVDVAEAVYSGMLDNMFLDVSAEGRVIGFR